MHRQLSARNIIPCEGRMQALQKELSYILTERDSHNTAGNIVVSKVKPFRQQLKV